MELLTKTFQTPNGTVEGIHVKWTGFSILMVTGEKGFIACPAIEPQLAGDYGAAAAIIESSPTNLIGTLDRFCDRKITQANEKAKALGIKEGMTAKEAFALIA